MRQPAIETVFFDLDGTLVDTAPDMAAALNRLLVEEGRQPLPYAHIRQQVSNGGRGLVLTGFGTGLPEDEIERLRRRFLELYNAALCVDSCLFPNMEHVLDRIEAAGLRWGVVTNKPGWLTEPLLETLGLLPRSACVVSGDTLPQRKPHPAPLLHACKLSRARPSASVYLGDARRDIEAGHAAGMSTLIAHFGYIPEDEKPDTWGADGDIQQPEDLLAWLQL